MSGYGDFSMFYDRLTADIHYAAAADYLLSLFQRHRGASPALVLDLACGSGSLTLELIRRGVDVIGVDASQDMLAAAREKTRAAGVEPLLLEQDMQELDLYGTVNGAVCMLDSLSHLPDTAAVSETLRRLHWFIEPGGLLIFDVNTPYKHKEILGDHAFVFEEDDFFCVWRNHYQARSHTVDMLLDFFVEGADGRYDRLTDRVRERAYTMSTWKRLLTEQGFQPLAVYGEGTTAPPKADCPRWVFVASNQPQDNKKGNIE